jgi:hypothetical protein
MVKASVLWHVISCRTVRNFAGECWTHIQSRLSGCGESSSFRNVDTHHEIRKSYILEDHIIESTSVRSQNVFLNYDLCMYITENLLCWEFVKSEEDFEAYMHLQISFFIYLSVHLGPIRLKIPSVNSCTLSKIMSLPRVSYCYYYYYYYYYVEYIIHITNWNCRF